jgi:hypothetical protein
MRIVVNHVTRMKSPRICVAGVDLDSREHVRPTTPAGDPITRAVLREERGPFGMGAVVDLGTVLPEPSPPEVEDHRFTVARARHVEDMEGDEFCSLLDEVSEPDLAKAFGPALGRVGDWRYATALGQGDRSLAVLQAGTRPELSVNRYGKLQLRFNDVDPQTYVSVTDVRFYTEDQKTIRSSVVDDVARRLRRGVDAFLMFGLARPFQAPRDDQQRHWLQLNGLCLVDNPVGDVP